jgi:DNA-binding transcriptional ArsR family regulator
VDGVFEALGDSTRRAILEFLSAGEQPAGLIVATLQERMRVSQPAVSQHLKVLRGAGLVIVRAEGTRRLYAMDEQRLRAAMQWLAQLVDPITPFEQPLDALATEVARGRRVSRRAAVHQGSVRSGEQEGRLA